MPDNNDLSRRDLLKAAGAVTAVASALPSLQTAKAAGEPFAMA